MLREQKTNQMGCPCEGTLEADSNKGARSVTALEFTKQNRVELLEEILSRNNLNEAYKWVKSKKDLCKKPKSGRASNGKQYKISRKQTEINSKAQEK